MKESYLSVKKPAESEIVIEKSKYLKMNKTNKFPKTANNRIILGI